MQLREGFTTGSCAAAAALACCLWQRDGVPPEQVTMTVPAGRVYAPTIIPHPDGSCGIIKDSGDDPDITDGLEIIARVTLLDRDGPIQYIAGEGVGTFTEPGLKFPPGEPAINPVPREMIEAAVREIIGARAAEVTISIPGGREIAEKTFNPRLGIVGGLSILGTSGIVRPMSDEALRDALLEELRMRRAQGHESLIYTFGNQGETAMHALWPEPPIVQVSNEIGWMLDQALELGIRHILLGGHPGKLIKISAGIMQTHSHTADGRRESMITQLALMGAPHDLAEAIYACRTTDAMMPLIHEYGFDSVWDRLAEAARTYCRLRVRKKLDMDVVILSSQGDILGKAMTSKQYVR
ncbi:MAG: cobalamin biosynthesis protein CbiD [Clostridia bacterium]|nr:cobalamin biosynthesis protein CbiD [Clostridia bacterium]